LTACYINIATVMTFKRAPPYRPNESLLNTQYKTPASGSDFNSQKPQYFHSVKILYSWDRIPFKWKDIFSRSILWIIKNNFKKSAS